MRIRDIAKIRPDTSFEIRAMRGRPQWPPRKPDLHIDLDSTAGLLQTLGRGGLLLQIEQETDRTTWWIGASQGSTKKWLWLVEVSSRAVWNRASTGLTLRAISAVSIRVTRVRHATLIAQ